MSELTVAALSLIGCVFAASAGGKYAGRDTYDSFRDGLAGTRLIPVRLLPVTALSLQAAETIIAACAVAALVLRAAGAAIGAPLAESVLAAAAALTAVLATGIAVIIRRGTQARCACFGARSGRPLGPVHLVRNLSLLAVISVGLAGAPVAHQQPASTSAALAAVAGAIAALIIIRWEDLSELFAPISSSAASGPPIREPGRRSG